MTEQYKIGDRVLWDAKITSIFPDKIWITSIANESCNIFFPIDPKELRPYTPRQDFENGEVVEVSDLDFWVKAIFIGKSHKQNSKNSYVVNCYDEIGNPDFIANFEHCRKHQPRETITICGVDYYKDDVEKALKDLKPIKGDL